MASTSFDLLLWEIEDLKNSWNIIEATLNSTQIAVNAGKLKLEKVSAGFRELIMSERSAPENLVTASKSQVLVVDSDDVFVNNDIENESASCDSNNNDSSRSQAPKSGKEYCKDNSEVLEDIRENIDMIKNESRKRCAVAFVGNCDELIDVKRRKFLEEDKFGVGQEAVDEFTGISDPKLSLFEEESMLQFKLTQFTVYDKSGIVPFDTGLIDKNTEIFFSGYLKHLLCEDPSIEDGVPVFDCGPINSWWNAGFDGGEKALTGLSTGFADYYLMEPSEMYQPLMNAVTEKSFLTKHVIEYLEKAVDPNNHMDAEYEDLLSHLSLIVRPEGMNPISGENLMRHADFVVNQVYSYDDAGDEDDPQLVGLPAMRTIIDKAGVMLSERRKLVIKKNKTMPKCSSVTVTPLVRAVFAEQMEEVQQEEKGSKAKRYRCGTCVECKRSDCGVCNHCKDMRKFGGTGRIKQACVERKCPKMASSSGAEETKVPEKSRSRSPVKRTDVEWKGEGIKKDSKTYFKTALLYGKLTVTLGDTVLLNPSDESIPYVAIITNLFDGPDGAMAHVQWLGRGTDTMLGEEANPTELFLLTDCEDQPLLSVWKKCSVDMKCEPEQATWRELGGRDVLPENMVDDGLKFWCQFWYGPENARFEYPRPLPECPQDEDRDSFCGMCIRKREEEDRWKPMLLEKSEDGEYTCLTWDNAPLKLGDTVYLDAGSVKLKIKQKEKKQATNAGKDDVDKNLYPEFYRKRDNVKGSNQDTPDPFELAIVKKIYKEHGEVTLGVQMFYRPEDTHMGSKAAESAYINQVYWSEEEGSVPFSAVTGRCYVKFVDLSVTDQQLEVWTDEGPDRWFFREWYNSTEKTFDEPPLSAQSIGHKGKGGKGKGGRGNSSANKYGNAPDFPPVEKLRCLDIFSGCGGLSQGLHEAGVAKSKWAVEIFEPAAKAYKSNNLDCTVFNDDCNVLLRKAIEGMETNSKGQKIPERGEVDILCAGPPCQGFSGLNRFNDTDSSQFKNSLMLTCLSYCEYYRPRFFILENVRNFAIYKNNKILKLCIRTLVKMGYQCSFGILQAGQFGVAQTRRRTILLAAAPGETLPLFPEPRHVFSPQACHLSVEIDDVRFATNARWVCAGPYRTTTVRDTISDLPKIKNGAAKLEISYGGEAKSNFQKIIRRGSEVLSDHVTMNMAPIVEARFEHIPKSPGSDWRDLPNKEVTLKDGTQCNKLVYSHDDVKQGKSSTGAKRGVCRCADGKSKCDPENKQQNTLIPWFLPHTSNRHSQWAGVYGRLEMDGFFSTTITNPKPMGIQGRVLHPDQNRIVSVRECARSQGFPDTYKFYGTVPEKYRQIGNAVPPPMGKAIGLQIREVIRKKPARN